MRKLLCVLLLANFCWLSPNFAQHCATDFYLQQQLKINPNLITKRAEIERFTQKWIAENSNHPSRRQVITIPVVVHVVWNTPSENISDAQIQSQIEVLNRDFRALNVEIPGVPAIFKPAIADAEIEFCLASRDPQGNATNGITRTQTNVSQFSPIRSICYADRGGHDAWDTQQYLNIWVGDISTSFLGEASFPGMDIPEEDGVRIHFEGFGTTGTASAPPYNLGRTVTHEIGHYFNLYHVWGQNINDPACEYDDEVNDTPRQSSTFRNECPVHPQIFCGTASMFMNFMNYTDDACMAMFTKGQKMRMLAALNGPRTGLLHSLGCQPPVGTNEESALAGNIRLLQNPVNEEIKLQSDWFINESILVSLINTRGQILFSETWQGNTFFTKNVSALSPGLYFLILQNETNIFTKKLIITH